MQTHVKTTVGIRFSHFGDEVKKTKTPLPMVSL